MFQTSPDFKGIKTRAGFAKRFAACSKPALISKGLRCQHLRQRSGRGRFQTSPDFKGIKTSCHSLRRQIPGSSPALISKGLRPRVVSVVEEVYFQAQKPVKRHAAGRGGGEKSEAPLRSPEPEPRSGDVERFIAPTPVVALPPPIPCPAASRRDLSSATAHLQPSWV